jgi:LPPG:FO 2-phospho-L-lactate transferase
MAGMQIVVLAGGIGGAKFLTGVRAVARESGATVTAVVNVGDDVTLHGLRICPDLDTCTYTLAEAVNPETGWGLAGETWQALDALRAYDPDRDWFALGDRDIGTHLYRTGRLAEGATLTSITAGITARWGLGLRLLPMTEDEVATRFTLADGTGDIGFQEYFVGRRHSVAVSGVHFDGIEDATPAPGVLAAIEDALTVVVAPSNPIVSIGPILAVPGVRDALRRRRDSVVAVSPIIAGGAVKGPADRLLTELGHQSSVVGVARLYAEVVGTLVIDEADADLATAVEAEGVRCVVAPTLMTGVAEAKALAEVTLA